MHKWILIFLTALSTLFAGSESEFFRACLEGNMDKVITLYNKEGLKLTFTRDKDRNTPLHLACCSKKGGNKKEIVDFLISNGVDVNAANEHGSTPLFIAVSNENYEGVELLLKTKGLKVNQPSKGLTPLHIAVMNDFSPMVKLLLNHPEINPNYGTQDGATPLHFAAKMGLTEIAHILINDPRVNLNAPQHDTIYSGATPLHFAAEQAQVEIVSALLETKKVRLNDQIDRGDFEGFTPLHLAVLNPDITQVFQTVQLLLKSGANPKIKSKLGQLPTDLTKVKMIQSLLKNPNFKLNE
ncbi:MAG: ankyrin repeat domain-containing protein [Chlamydiia bacterium]|nr:ankyrin repeat domain-containing protein [Chlamydiia bacterium]